MARTSPVRNICGFFATIGLLTASAALASPVTAPVLEVHGATLTSYKPTATTPVQALRPRFDQRGVDIDGTLRATAPLGWTVNADPFGGGYASGRTLGDVNLFTGSYHPTEVDLALPTLGLPVVIGRTYSNVQRDSGGSLFASDGYQGWNWAQMAQPEIRFAAGGTAADDTVYLIYGADRYIEFDRVGTDPEFKAKNGAAGVMQYAVGASTEPDTYTYTDQQGNRIVFFGFDGDSGAAAGQLWKMIDRGGNTAYVGDASTGSTAISSGFISSTGRVYRMFDASGRQYEFTYDTYGGKTRLKKVEASVSATVVAKVEYDYYTSTENDKGMAGDLRLVTITQPTDNGNYVRRKYYRYYTEWDNSDGKRGLAHAIKMVVGFEGTRGYDYAGDATFDQDYYGETDTNLKPYSDLYIECTSSTDERIWKVTFNGNCGCGGGASGEHVLTYGDVTGYSTAAGNTSYDTGWGKRTVIDQPDTTWVTQYFDETGAVLGRVITNGDPSGSPTKKWITDVVRNGNGQVATIHSPENITAYTHSTGSITASTSVGLVTEYARRTTSDNLIGLRESVSVRPGTSGSASMVSSITMNDRQLHVGSSTGVTVPTLATMSSYPAGSAVTTTVTTSYWENSTESDPLYIAPTRIRQAITVDSGKNGSGSANYTDRFLREDGSVSFVQDPLGVLMYTGRDGYGQTAAQIADANLGGSGFLNGDESVGAWSFRTYGGVTKIHAVTTMEHDAQGRVTTLTQPSVSGTRTSARVTGVLADGRMYMWSFPGQTVSAGESPVTTYFGPASYSGINHAGKPDRQATVAVSSSGITSLPSTTPDSDWSAMVDNVYDSSGMRLTETKTYTSTSTSNSSYFGYDSMGRRERVVDFSGTITRSVFDDRGFSTERWVGTNDNSSSGMGGTDNMTKVEVMEYDGNASGGGKNGNLTKRTMDEDGNWATTGDQRATTTTYDYRNRAVVTANPVPPHTLTKYDNANRAIAVGQYSSAGSLTATTDPTSTATNRKGLSETLYDERGQVYQTIRWGIDQSNGAKLTGLYVDNWYDENGRLAKTAGPQIAKNAYDRLGRVTCRSILAQANDSTWSDAMTTATDTVLEEQRTAYDPESGRPLLQYTVMRNHDDDMHTPPSSGGTGGPLDDNADGDLTIAPGSIDGRVQITGLWYDDLDRVIETVNLGTNGGSSYTWSGTIPSRSDTALRTSTIYDDFGRVYQVFDVDNIQTRTAYDFRGRRSQVIENYDNGTVGGGTNNDKDRITEYGYDGAGSVGAGIGMLTSMTRKVPSSQDQVTAYHYGAVKGTNGSLISDNRLLLKTVLPPQYETPSVQPESDRRTLYAYNAIGEAIVTTDPGGNTITTAYDGVGRLSARYLSSAGAGFDDRIIEVDFTYTSLGQLETVYQKAKGSVLADEVTYSYDGYGNLASMTQDPVDRDEFQSGYAYYDFSSLGWRRFGLVEIDLPNGNKLYPAYESGTADAAVARPTHIEDTGMGIRISTYRYMGASTVVGALHEEPNASSTMYAGGGSGDYATYLDRFNRPILNQWVGGTGSVAFADFTVDWNRSGQPIDVGDVAQAGQFSSTTSYDSLRRVMSRLGGQFGEEQLLRDIGGRIGTNKVDLNNNSTFTDGPLNVKEGGERNDARTFNKRNELLARSVYDADNVGSPRPVTLAYDKNGNLTDDGETYKYVYNVFGQLVKILDHSTDDPVAIYTYNGLGQRTSEQLDTNDAYDSGTPDGIVDGYDPVFYFALDQQGRRLGTYRGTDYFPKEWLFWHPAELSGPAFKGGLILRERNESLTDTTQWALEEGQEGRGERMYACSDFKGDLVTLIKPVDGGAQIVENVRYSATGMPYNVLAGDMDCNGVVTGSAEDAEALTGMIESAYEVGGDLNLDGEIDLDDVDILIANNGVQTGRGKLSAPAVGSRVGYKNTEAFGEGFGTIWSATQHHDSTASGLGSSLNSKLVHLFEAVSLRRDLALLQPLAPIKPPIRWWNIPPKPPSCTGNEACTKSVTRCLGPFVTFVRVSGTCRSRDLPSYVYNTIRERGKMLCGIPSPPLVADTCISPCACIEHEGTPEPPRPGDNSVAPDDWVESDGQGCSWHIFIEVIRETTNYSGRCVRDDIAIAY